MAVELSTKPEWVFTCDVCAKTEKANQKLPETWDTLPHDSKNEKWEVHVCATCAEKTSLTALRNLQVGLYRAKATAYGN